MPEIKRAQFQAPGISFFNDEGLKLGHFDIFDILFPSLLFVKFFTITAEIHARSLVNFYGQYAERHMNVKFMRRVSQRERVLS